MLKRCAWCGEDPLYRAYHDEEWGLPVHDDRQLFEMLILEGAQAGLSWLTILKKRQNYRKAFDHFDAEKIARYSDSDLARLLADPGIVRNRLKIESAIKNAQGVLAYKKSSALWILFSGVMSMANPGKTPGTQVLNCPLRQKHPRTMSNDLKQRGFNFVGPTICYAFMQSVGMVNDHTVDCFRYDQVRQSL